MKHTSILVTFASLLTSISFSACKVSFPYSIVDFRVPFAGEMRANFGMDAKVEYAEVKIGNLSQSFKVVFHTSSNESWIPLRSEASPAGFECHPETCSILFNQSLNYTLPEMSRTISGRVYQDILQIAGPSLTSSERSYVNRNVSFYHSFISGWANAEYGVYGLAPFANRHIWQYIDNEQKNDKIINPYQEDQEGKTRLIVFHNGVSFSRRNLDNLQHKCQNLGSGRFWNVPLKEVHFEDIRLSKDVNLEFNSGLSGIYAPKDKRAKIRSAIHGSMNEFDCKKRFDLPNLEFTINDRVIEINGTQYTKLVRRREDVNCYISIGYSNNDDWVFGFDIIQDVFGMLVLDYDNKRVCF